MKDFRKLETWIWFLKGALIAEGLVSLVCIVIYFCGVFPFVGLISQYVLWFLILICWNVLSIIKKVKDRKKDGKKIDS